MVISVLVESDGVWTPEGLRATLEAPVRDGGRAWAPGGGVKSCERMFGFFFPARKNPLGGCTPL